MTIGTQEIVAIGLVTVVVCFALYRRLRAKPGPDSACSNCDHAHVGTDEKILRFYRKRR